MISRTSDINRTFHTIIKSDMAFYWPLVSKTSDISAIWYHLFIWYHFTCAARWYGSGAPQAPPRPASPPPGTGAGCSAERRQTWSRARTCCSVVSPCNLKLQVQVDVEAPRWQWAWSLGLTCAAQVGHLAIASFATLAYCQGPDSWLTDCELDCPGAGSADLESFSDWPGHQPRLYHGSRKASMSSRTSLYERYYAALIIVTLHHTVPLQFLLYLIQY